MNIFDDLGDPLGTPAGAALGTVLARSRRRRAAHRSAAALAALVAVVTIAASANALIGSRSSAVHVVGQPSTVPARTPTTRVAPHDTIPTQLANGSGPWSDPALTITPRSLGGVRVGMSQTDAQTAAGFSFDAGGDGFVYPTTLPARFPHDYVGMTGPYGNETVGCVGASLWAGSKTSSQTISTPEGFRLGGTVQQLKAVYGSRVRYVAAPSSGMTTNAGYVVAEPGGYLAFVVGRSLTNWLPPTNRASGFVVEIAGSKTANPMSVRPDFGPNSCTG